MPSSRRHLVVARVGDGSLHPTWVQGERSFDLVVDYYGDTPGRWDGTADLVLESKGSKWQGLHAVLTANPHFLTDYEAVWFPDDDIATDAATISAAFALHGELGLGLSQPALTTDSYFTHLMTLAHPGLAVRVTNFVEVMVPMFSREALAACWETFDESRSGYGLDLVWQAVLPGLGLRSAVFDCLTVRHTRPLGSGTLYQGMAETPAVEGARVAKAHGMPTPTPSEVHEVLTADGAYLTGAAAEELVRRSLPVPTVQDVPSWDLYSRFLEQRSQRRSAGPRPAAAVSRPGGHLAPAHLDLPQLPVSHLDGPLVLVAGSADRDQRAARWRASGWQVLAVPGAAPGGRQELGPWLAVAEQHPVRALDVVDDDADALERAVQRGAAAGAVVVARATPAAARCHHDLSAQALAFTGRCEACALQWRTVVDRCAALVATPEASAVLSALGVDVLPGAEPGADDLAEVASLAASPAVPPMTVVVVSSPATAHLVAATTSSLDRQRGLTAPCELVVADVAGDPRALGRAAAGARHDRVLVLSAGDTASPWCVADHHRAAQAEAERRGPGSAGGVVVSGARPSLLRGEDVYETALQGGAEPMATGERASLPTAALQGLASGLGMASAYEVAVVVQRLAEPTRLPSPTHEAVRSDDLSTERDAVVSAVLAAAVVHAPASDRETTARLVHWSHAGDETARLAATLLEADEPGLRWSVMGLVTGERGTDLLQNVLRRDLAAHVAAADLAVLAVRAAVAAGRPWHLAVDADDERLVPLLVAADHQVRTGELDPTGLRVVVVLDPRGHAGDERAFAQHLSDRLAAQGASTTALGLVDVVTSSAPARRWLAADVTLPVAGEPWFQGLPVPLLALEPAAWLGHLDVVALAARAEAAAAPAPVPASPVALRLPTQTRPVHAGVPA